ncbi:MAG: EAL domain-containing protein [Burkholderiales bacterium]|nr:EAL domain-containing protein [Burkholderiales bacterium]
MIAIRPAEPTTAIRVLLLEDLDADAGLTIRELKRSGASYDVLRVETREAFAEALTTFEPDIVLSDFSLPRFDGLSALHIAQQRYPDIPFVFVSGTIGEERAVEAMRRGATDYVLKEHLERLGPVVQRALKESAERQARRKAEEDLTRTQQRLDAILGSLVDVVWSRSIATGELVYLSPGIEAIYRRSTDEFHRTPSLWLDVIHVDDRADVTRRFDAALQGDIFDAEYRIARPNGEIRWIHDRAHAVRDDTGTVIRLDGLARDITDRKVLAVRIDRLSRIRQVLGDINGAMLRATDRDALLQEACRIAVESGQMRMAWVGIASADRSQIRPAACMGHEAGYLEAIDDLLMAPERNQVSAYRALLQNRPFVCNDIEADTTSPSRQAALDRGYRSLIALPLMVDNEVVAVFALYAAEANFFDEDEIQLLSELAGDISFELGWLATEERLQFLAYYDVLTGLCNRQFLEMRLLQELTHAQSRHETIEVLSIDLDNFKRINDSIGHHVGDVVLKTIATRLTQCLSPEDVLARYGADEFVVVLVHRERTVESSRMIRRILETVAQPVRTGEHEFTLTASIGVSVFPQDGTDGPTLLRNADAALHRAKDIGRNGFQFYAQEMNAAVTESLVLDANVRRALERDEFALHFQPKASVHDGAVTGFEALLRWTSQELGPVSPAKFIPILEDNGLIVPIGEWVLRSACEQINAWRDAGIFPLPIAVNLSGVQLQQDDLDRRVEAILTETGVDAELIELEITETVLMRDPERVIGTLRKLRQMGVRLSVDDFGTGYSSLSYLRSFPLDSLKIDRSFISDVTTNPDAALIARTIISMAHSLRLKVIAEGVETGPQLAFLATNGCDEIQGFHFARPADSFATTTLLLDGRTLDISLLRSAGEALPAVLIIGDEDTALTTLAAVLRDDGRRVLSASTASAGFEHLASERIGLVLANHGISDMATPELLDRVKDLYPATARMVLVRTANVDPALTAAGIETLGASLLDPERRDALRRRIDIAFDRYYRSSGPKR